MSHFLTEDRSIWRCIELPKRKIGAQVAGTGVGVGRDDFGASFHDYLPSVEDDRSVTQLQGFVDRVIGQEDADGPIAREGFDSLLQVGDRGEETMSSSTGRVARHWPAAVYHIIEVAVVLDEYGFMYCAIRSSQ